MEVVPKILLAKVMHARLHPKVNKFSYGLYYLFLPLSKLDELPIPRNKFGFMSFYDRDHGRRDGSDLNDWIRNILSQYNVGDADGEIYLICMPRVFGYVFNPVSFWLCCDKKDNLKAVLCEVNNTFGENHSYLCINASEKPDSKKTTLKADKVFHVSPFLEREGHYQFRFDISNQVFKTWIDLYDSQDKKKLVTSLVGHYLPMTKYNCRKVFWQYPLVTFKAIGLIHWQAIKLIFKGIGYIAKPKPLEYKISKTKSR